MILLTCNLLAIAIIPPRLGKQSDRIKRLSPHLGLADLFLGAKWGKRTLKSHRVKYTQLTH